MGKAQAYEKITPPHDIARKVTRDGPPVEELLQKAEAAVADLRSDYADWVREDLGRLDHALASLRQAPASQDAIDGVYVVAHDMKGEGGTFGYPLITRIGGSLCRYLRGRAKGSHDMNVLAAHINAMKAVIKNKVEGDGGDIGRALAHELESVVAAAGS